MPLASDLRTALFAGTVLLLAVPAVRAAPIEPVGKSPVRPASAGTARTLRWTACLRQGAAPDGRPLRVTDCCLHLLKTADGAPVQPIPRANPPEEGQ